MMLQIQDVIVGLDIITREFCCNIGRCKGACCIEGDAGAPVTVEEIASIEEILPIIWENLSPKAQNTIRERGISYADPEGELVTQIVDGKDCVFTCYDASGTCLCAIERAYREGKCSFIKPISCHLYPIRVKKLGNYVGLNYSSWDICSSALIKGRREHIPLYKALREPLIRCFGSSWYEELELTVREMKREGLI